MASAAILSVPIPNQNSNPKEDKMDKSTKCTCWQDYDATLRDRGVKLSDKCKFIKAEGFTLVYGIPLQRIDGKRMKRSDPKMIGMTYCPFCGRKL